MALPPAQLREVSDGLYSPPQVFAPRDLEIIDRVYEATWASITARDPFRDTASDGEYQEVLRKRIMDLTGWERIEFDALYEKVLANLPEPWPPNHTQEGSA